MRVPEDRLGQVGLCIRCGKTISVTYGNTRSADAAPPRAPGGSPPGTSFEALGGPDLVRPPQYPPPMPGYAPSGPPNPFGGASAALPGVSVAMPSPAPQPVAWMPRTDAEETPLPKEDGAFPLGAYFWLATLLFLACLLPRVSAGFPAEGARVHFVNFEVMLDGAQPITARLASGFPLLAGFLIILAAAALPGVARSLVLLLPGAAYLLLIAVDPELRQDTGSWLRETFAPLIPALLGVTASWIGIAGLFVGSRARYARPAGRAAGRISAAAAGAYLVGLVVPVARPAMPGFAGFLAHGTENGVLSRIPFISPLIILSDSETPWQYRATALTAFLAILLLLSACVLAFLNAGPRPGARSRAQGAFWLWMCHFALICVGWTVLAVAIMLKISPTHLPDDLLYAPTLDIPLMLLKDCAFRYGIVLLALMGATDLVVTLRDRDQERRRVAAYAATL